MGGLLYLGGLRFLQFLAAVFRFFTNIGAVFRFWRLLRFAEMDLFLTRFSALSYICSGFSVFEKYAVCGYSLPYCVLRFAGISPLITACALRQWDAANDLWSPCKWTMYDRYLSVRSIDIFQYPVIRWIHDIAFTVRSFETDKVWLDTSVVFDKSCFWKLWTWNPTISW